LENFFQKNVRQRDNITVEKLKGAVSAIVDLTPLYLRPDAHTRDGLHYCLNGVSGTPLTLAGIGIYHALLEPEKSIV
jgi:hypothetical protein